VAGALFWKPRNEKPDLSGAFAARGPPPSKVDLAKLEKGESPDKLVEGTTCDDLAARIGMPTPGAAVFGGAIDRLTFNRLGQAGDRTCFAGNRDQPWDSGDWLPMRGLPVT
jgi:hypothetical protein